MLYEKVAELCQNNNLAIAKLERECEMGKTEQFVVGKIPVPQSKILKK